MGQRLTASGMRDISCGSSVQVGYSHKDYIYVNFLVLESENLVEGPVMGSSPLASGCLSLSLFFIVCRFSGHL